MNSATPFDISGRVYDLLYSDKDHAAESEYIAAILRRFHSEVQSVLDLGCGTGRHARKLLDLGLEVVGVERSAEMATRAREIDGLTVIDGDIRTVVIERDFDAVLALFHVVSYQTTTKDLIATFSTAARHLREGGLFVFDVWSTAAVMAQGPETRVREVSDGRVDVVRTARPMEDAQRSIVKVHYEFQVTKRATGVRKVFHETHTMRHLTEGEIQLLAHVSGLELLHAEEYLSGAEPSVDTWGVCYVLRKNR